MDLNLKGKSAIVCGSTQGIGKSAAIELAQLGASITLIARNEDKLRDTLDELPRVDGQVHHMLCADFQYPEILKDKINAHIGEGHEIQLLVNNTGGPPGGPIIDAEYEDFDHAFRAHLQCSHILVKAVIPAMKKARFGRIINVISTSVKIPIAGLGVSNTTRGAMASWSKTLSVELAPLGITVNNVLPGFTKTGRLASLIESRAAASEKSRESIENEMIASIPAGRLGHPTEVAALIAFLASPAAGYISGTNIPVDGARTGAF